MATNPNDAVGTNTAYSGRTSPNSFNDVLALFTGRGVLSGWQCSPSNNMVVTLGGQNGIRDVAIAEDNAGNKTTIDNISQEPIGVEITAASNTSASTDYLVAYVNNPPQGTPLAGDNPGAVGLIDVRGSGAAAPTEAQIRAAITADGGTGVTAYYVILATIAVAAGTTAITASNITQGAESLSSQAVQHPLYAIDLAVENDTPAGWGDIFGGNDGHYWIRYSTVNRFPSQLNQWGILETWKYGDDIYQRWRSMPDGPTYERSGNLIGWSNGSSVGASVTGSQAWTEINTNSKTGLGGNVIHMNTTDLNSYPTKSGFYDGVNGANRPISDTAARYYVIQQYFNEGYGQQIFTKFSGEFVFIRSKQNGTWSPWRHLGDDVHATSEQPIGTWINGKTIYRKVVNTGAINSATKNVAHGISNLSMVTDLRGIAISSRGYFTLPRVNGDNVKFQVELNADSTNIQIGVGAGAEAVFTNSYVTIEYTKN